MIADGPPARVLAGGTYFATETARILGGAGGALAPADGVALLRPGAERGDRMSWQLGAFAILALGARGGFAWYERTRPDARIVALVGTLAAFAALGRIAFAAVPNVKPTTDIVLISGYALGGPPGSSSARSRGSPRTSSSARGRGRRGRWPPGASPACSAPGWRR